MMKKLILVLALFSTTAFAKELQLNTRNTVILRGEVNGATMGKAQLEIANLRKKGDQEIYLVIDSPGGSVQDGEAFIEYAKGVSKLSTVTFFAASMASAIVEAIPGKRYIVDSGVTMFHRATASAQGTVEVGTLETHLAFIKSQILRLEMRNAARLQLPIEKYKALVKDELWLTASESLRMKSVDEIVDLKCSKELQDSTEEVEVSNFFGSMIVTYSKCPLFQYPLSVKAN